MSKYIRYHEWLQESCPNLPRKIKKQLLGTRSNRGPFNLAEVCAADPDIIPAIIELYNEEETPLTYLLNLNNNE